jgi:hypothetical protein
MALERLRLNPSVTFLNHGIGASSLQRPRTTARLRTLTDSRSERLALFTQSKFGVIHRGTHGDLQKLAVL